MSCREKPRATTPVTPPASTARNQDSSEPAPEASPTREAPSQEEPATDPDLITTPEGGPAVDSTDRSVCVKARPGYFKRELRGVWIASVDSDALDSSGNIDKAMERIKAMRLNTVFPVVWNKGGVFFKAPESLAVLGESRNTPLAFAQRDVLGEIVQSASARGLRVVPWFEYGLKVPSDMPIVKAHPQWFLRDANQALDRVFGPIRIAYLNPLHPEAQDFLIRLFVSLFDRYGVDAIQLDDHFAMPTELAFDAYTVALYRTEHKGNPPPASPFDPKWMKWRADKFTTFVKKLADSVHARGKKLSLAPNTYNVAYATTLQDWRTWALKGYVDDIVMQVYRRDLGSLQNVLSQDYVKEVSACVPFSIGVLAGVSGRPLNSADLIKMQSREVFTRSLDGVSFFHYTFLSDGAPNPVEISVGLQEIFSDRM